MLMSNILIQINQFNCLEHIMTTNENENTQSVPCSLNIKATASLNEEVLEDLHAEDKSLGELLDGQEETTEKSE